MALVGAIIEPQLNVETKLDLERYIPIEMILEIASMLDPADAIAFQLRITTRLPPSFWMRVIERISPITHTWILSTQLGLADMYTNPVSLNKALRKYYMSDHLRLNPDDIKLMLMAGLYMDSTLLPTFVDPYAAILYLRLSEPDLQDVFEVHLSFMLNNLDAGRPGSVLYYIVSQGVVINSASLAEIFVVQDGLESLFELSKVAALCPIHTDTKNLNVNIEGLTLFEHMLIKMSEVALVVMENPSIDIDRLKFLRRGYPNNPAKQRLLELRPDLSIL